LSYERWAVESVGGPIVDLIRVVSPSPGRSVTTGPSRHVGRSGRRSRCWCARPTGRPAHRPRTAASGRSGRTGSTGRRRRNSTSC